MAGVPNHPLAILMYALREETSRVIAVPLMACVRHSRIRRRPIRADNRTGRVGAEQVPPEPSVGHVERGELILNVPPQVVHQIQGPIEDRDVMLVVTIPQDVYARAISPIIQPVPPRPEPPTNGSGGSGPRRLIVSG